MTGKARGGSKVSVSLSEEAVEQMRNMDVTKCLEINTKDNFILSYYMHKLILKT